METDAISKTADETGGSTACSQDELVERAREMAKVAAGRADVTERERRVPDETIADLWDAGLMRIVQPPAWGGMGRSPLDFYELVHEVSRGCGSTGWTFCVLAGHSAMVGEFPEQAQTEVWGEDDSVTVSSAVAPTLRAKRVEGGYQVKGDAPFSSGCDHGSWGVLGGVVENEDGTVESKVFLVPRRDYTIVDDWFTLGLGGTGSKTLRLSGCFVPEYRVAPLTDALFTGIAPFGLQSAMVGSARGGVDSFVEMIRNKPGKFGGPPPAESELFLSAIGHSIGEVTFAWELVQKVTAETLPHEMPGKTVPPEQVKRNRAAAGLVSRLSIAAVERLYELSGGHGVFDNRLSRALRDVRTAANHAALSPVGASVTAGILELKGSTDAPGPWSKAT